jgi:hypothetical protein
MDLKDRILNSDFAAKKNLLYNLRSKNIFLMILVITPLGYGISGIFGPKNRFSISSRYAISNGRSLFTDFVTGSPVILRLHLRPEIYMKENSIQLQKYVDFLNNDLKSTRKNYIWK